MEKMTDEMANAARIAGIKLGRAEEIYKMKVLGYEFDQKNSGSLNITFKEAEWFMDIIEILEKQYGYWNPQCVSSTRRRKAVKEFIYGAILSEHGEAVIHEAKDYLYSEAKRITNENKGRINDIVLGPDDFEEIAERISHHDYIESLSSEAKGSCMPPDEE